MTNPNEVKETLDRLQSAARVAPNHDLLRTAANLIEQQQGEIESERLSHGAAKKWAEAERRRADTYRQQLAALRSELSGDEDGASGKENSQVSEAPKQSPCEAIERVGGS